MKATSAMVLACMAVLPFSAAQADTRFTGDIGYEMGGDTIVKVIFVGGDTQEIKGGDGFVMNGGAVTDLNDAKDLSLAFTVGWKYSSISTSDGDVSVSRFPLEATLFKDVGSHRFGLGAVYHAAIKMEGTGALSAINEYSDAFTSNVGFSAQYHYSFSPNWSLGGRLTTLEYSSDVGDDVDASSAGLVFTGRF